MEKETLIKEIMWEYNHRYQKALDIVEFYEDRNKYDELCQLVIDKKPLHVM